MNEYGLVTEYTQSSNGDFIEATREPTDKEKAEADRRIRALLDCMEHSEADHG